MTSVQTRDFWDKTSFWCKFVWISVGIPRDSKGKKIEGNPLDPEKAAKDQIEDPKVETKEEIVPPKKN